MTRARPPEGNFFEDLAVGQVFRHAVPRTLTEADATLYMSLIGDRHPLQCSKPLALAMGYPACPIDDFLVFNIAFGATVADISYNAIANLGVADVRFLAPVYAGDTIACESEVIGVKPSSKGTSGVVYVRSRAFNQDGIEVLAWVRWSIVAARGRIESSGFVLPTFPDEVEPEHFRIPAFVRGAALEPRATGSARRWEDYDAGMQFDHPGGTTVGATEHMIATRLYQNPAPLHSDALAARSKPFKRRVVFGGHILSLCRALSCFGLENAFAIAAIHSGTHVNATFGNDTLYCRHVVLGRNEIPGRTDLGALRLRMLGVKNAPLESVTTPPMGGSDPSVVLDVDYSVLIPRGKS